MAKRQHQVLVVGTGSIGERHVRCFQMTGRAEVALVELDDARCAEVTQCYNVRRSYASLEVSLGDFHDAAVIATPAPLHIPMARQIAEAGLHLLVEKPLSTSLAGVQDLEQLVTSKGLVAAVGYSWRAIPAVAALHEAVAKGKFGPPLQVIAVTGQNFPHYRPAYREIYYRDRASGGGAIQDAMTHVLNAGEWIAGPIDRLVADCSHLALDGVDVEDTVHVLTRQGNALGCYSLNQHQAPNEAVITVICERGTLRAEVHRARLYWMTRPNTAWETQKLGKIDRDYAYVRQADAFLDAIEGSSSPLCTLAEGVQSLKVNLAVIASCSSLDGWRIV